ncbi:MAG: acetyl-CoA carboxylase carboxyltransferase subunit alpha [Candidatus Omnitrophica bacterium]|nr:acetyl-CoA carboxylase carboxyltransferase subunit alpha [Candidatus Omnitrophota bacterium]
MAGELDFEKPIVEIERKIEELRSVTADKKLDFEPEIRKLEARLEKMKKEVFSNLTPWQKIQLARHPKRPLTLDYVRMIFSDFVELHGDRLFGDDKALVGGLAFFEKRPMMILGHQKGRDIKENIRRNFGSAHPEGYRKAMRLMAMAEKFHLPLVCFVDTPGAYPGIGAEERGQAHAIAENIRFMASLHIPVIVIVIGEGGSGGALGVGMGDRICVLENAYYSVISPEGCSAILWKDRTKAREAAECLKLTAKDLLEFKLIDRIIEEPLGGAHRDADAMALRVKSVIQEYLDEFEKIDTDELVQQRYEKFRRMGIFEEAAQ